MLKAFPKCAAPWCSPRSHCPRKMPECLEGGGTEVRVGRMGGNLWVLWGPVTVQVERTGWKGRPGITGRSEWYGIGKLSNSRDDKD